MDLIWPGFLLLLVLIPILIGVYIWVLRRKTRNSVRYSSLSLIREALPKYSWLRRHFPFVLFVLGLVSLIFALTRPMAILTVPTNQTTVIIAIDASRSMCSTDIKPNRIEAAKSAALSFIKSQNSQTQIGIVVFAGFAAIIQPPTDDQKLLQIAVERIATASRTAIGSAIEKSIDAIAEIDKSIPPSDSSITNGVIPPPVPKGAYAPAIIVLLTDGVSNVGPLPMDAAQEAANRGIRVFTIGFGTNANESVPNCGQQLGFGGGQFGFGGGRQNGGGFNRALDAVTLKSVADLTGGSYYTAVSASELQKVFEGLPMDLVIKHESFEISVLFTAVGALLAALSILLSILWHPLL